MADVLIVSGEKAWQPLRAMFAPPPAQAQLAANAGEARRVLAGQHSPARAGGGEHAAAR